MDNLAKVERIAALGKEEARLMRRLLKMQAERCKLLCDGYTANATTLGLDPSIDPNVIQPKTEDGQP